MANEKTSMTVAAAVAAAAALGFCAAALAGKRACGAAADVGIESLP